MGATTKNGRSRNRRAIPASQPPEGYPFLVLIAQGLRTSATEMVFGTFDQAGDDYPYANITGTGVVMLKEKNIANQVEATVSYDPISGGFKITFTDPPPDDSEYIFPPWCTEVRGLNGEWVAPALVSVGAWPP